MTSKRLFSIVVGLFLCIMLMVSPAFATGSIIGSVTIYDENGTMKRDHSGIVVFLDEMTNPGEVYVPEEPAVMTQINKSFYPDILPVVVGQSVELPNEDNISHNAFSLSPQNNFDVGIYGKGQSKTVTFNDPGLVTVYCNIHPQMIAHILVLTNNHFTVTGPDGTFEIPGVPPGSAVLRTWHGSGREYPEIKIVVNEDGSITSPNGRGLDVIEMDIRESPVELKHKNKFGQFYTTNY